MATPKLVRLAGIDFSYSAENDWINILSRFAESLQPGGAGTVQILRKVLVFGLLQKVRQRFLKRLPEALKMSISGTRPTNLRERAVERIDTGKSVTRLQLAYKTLDTAILSGSTRRIVSAQNQLNKTKEQLLNKLDGRQRASQVAMQRRQRDRQASSFLQSTGYVALGAIAGGLFRRTAMNVLEELTSATTLSRPTVSAIGTTLGAGSVSVLNSPALETPSATQLLKSVRTSSTKRSLWRHLEYGTGSYAKFQKDQLTSSKYSRGNKWLYGYSDGGNDRGIYAYGTAPMNFLFPQGSMNGYYPDDRESAQAALNEIMQHLAPLPDYAYIF